MSNRFINGDINVANKVDWKSYWVQSGMNITAKWNIKYTSEHLEYVQLVEDCINGKLINNTYNLNGRKEYIDAMLAGIKSTLFSESMYFMLYMESNKMSQNALIEFITLNILDVIEDNDD